MQTDTLHYYRFSYISSTGRDDPKYQATAKVCGSVVVDLVIKTEAPLDDPRPVIEWVKSQPDCIRFSSWDEYSPELVAKLKANLDQQAVEFDPNASVAANSVAESDR